MEDIYERIIAKKGRIAVVGLGYVGLPLAVELARRVSVTGYDINPARVEMMRRGIDPSRELSAADFEGIDMEFTSDEEHLDDACFYIVAVPTPVDACNRPDLCHLLEAARMVGRHLKRGDYVVFESTVWPGCVEEECVPILEKESGLTCVNDFKVGYSPERINPGDREHTVAHTVKIVSGCDRESLEAIAAVYGIAVRAGVHMAPSIRVAEAAKIIENTQRDVNIALMNELSMLFSRMGINTYDVIEAASTKWNFLSFVPGLVGGHCIGVDPYYLEHKGRLMGYDCQVISAARSINDSMGRYVGRSIMDELVSLRGGVAGAKVLVMGFTFKENVADIRNSRVADIVGELRLGGAEVDVTDPYADGRGVEQMYGITLSESPKQRRYDVVVAAVAHDCYRRLDEEYFTRIMEPDGLLVDLKGIYRNRIKRLRYRSL